MHAALTHRGQHPTGRPDDKAWSNRSRVKQNGLRGDEDARADHGAHDQTDGTQQADLSTEAMAADVSLPRSPWEYLEWHRQQNSAGKRFFFLNVPL